jgi:hypothetical protein
MGAGKCKSVHFRTLLFHQLFFFSPSRRQIFCKLCSSKNAKLASSKKAERVCNNCYNELT